MPKWDLSNLLCFPCQRCAIFRYLSCGCSHSHQAPLSLSLFHFLLSSRLPLSIQHSFIPFTPSLPSSVGHLYIQRWIERTLPFSLSLPPCSHIIHNFNTRRAFFAHKTEMQCVFRCYPQRFLAQPPPLPLHSVTKTKSVSASQRTSPLSFAVAASKHQQKRSLQTSSSRRGDKSCLVGKGTPATTAGQNSAGTKEQQITTMISEVSHPGSSFFVHRFGNSCRRTFNSFSRAAPSSSTNNNVRPFSTTASAYNSSNKNSSFTGLDSLQTWRRPYHYPSSKASQDVRSLATMPSKPTLQAIPNSISDPATRLQRSLTAVPHHNIKNEIKLRCTEFDHKGNVKTTAGEFLKSDLCQLVSLSSGRKYFCCR